MSHQVRGLAESSPHTTRTLFPGGNSAKMTLGNFKSFRSAFDRENGKGKIRSAHSRHFHVEMQVFGRTDYFSIDTDAFSPSSTAESERTERARARSCIIFVNIILLPLHSLVTMLTGQKKRIDRM